TNFANLDISPFSATERGFSGLMGAAGSLRTSRGTFGGVSGGAVRSEWMEFGEAVRSRRQARGMTLGELAEAAGLSKAMLSEIETLKKNPTLRIACSIALALDCQISDLLDVPGTEDTFQPLTAENRRVLVDASSGVQRILLAPQMVKHGVQVLHFVFPPGAVADFNADAQGVLEHVTCLEGRLRVRVGSQETERS